MKEEIDKKSLIVVDGHNFIFNFFKTGRLSRGKIEYLKEKLIYDLGWYKNLKSCDVIVVFDARKGANPRRSRSVIDGVEVIYSRKDETADDIIEEIAASKKGYEKTFVVTSDYLQQKVVFKKNVYRKSVREFNIELRDFKKKIRETMIGRRSDPRRDFFPLKKKLQMDEETKKSDK
ncbi:MAG: NYN domain-containing protein [Actinomycetota bacterium]|nr:NYN domain-containing protein [Actinomycetota bacterium]